MDLQNQLPVPISATAWDEIISIYTTKNIPDGYGLRLQVKGGACAGVSYSLGFDLPTVADKTYMINNVLVIIEKKHFMHLMGKKIDFINNTETRGFVFLDE